MDQIPQLVGAVLILLAFGASQLDRMSPHSLVYLLLNLIGSVVLTWVALVEEDWGFFLLEVVWAVVSAFGLARLARGKAPRTAH